jgi:hypothetical protein
MKGVMERAYRWRRIGNQRLKRRSREYMCCRPGERLVPISQSVSTMFSSTINRNNRAILSLIITTPQALKKKKKGTWT